MPRHRQHQHHSSSFPACFRPSSAADDTLKASPPPPQGKINLTTCFYHTNLGLFSLAWSRSFLGHSLLLNLHPPSHFSLPSSLHFHLLIKPFVFWKKYGNKKLSTATIPNVHVFWDFSRAKFGSGPEPESGFYIAVVVDGEMILLVGVFDFDVFGVVVTEWESVEESELSAPKGFSLLVYAWKK
ncbi:hypothetical protein V6N13_051613 [Hibiscus sabdariffa]|uniref:Uncharacterized protein n=1 Tax=Hibiscus sabdariffa TaxID=183260 RepID=A0ABR2T4S5_9ROSI